MSFFSWLSGTKYDMTVEIISYDYKLDSGKLSLTSSKDCSLENISFIITSDNDESDWINGFFGDYDRFYDEEEILGVYTNLMAGIPITINFSSKSLKEFTLQNIEKYIADIRIDPDYGYDEDSETCIDSFMDPEWNMVVSIDGTDIGSAIIPYENEEVIEYMENLNKEDSGFITNKLES